MTLTSIVAAVALIAILVFIHELGHFLVAKACGVHVHVFSIGFGRRLIGFNFRGTDYRLSALPFGGYVQMAGADPFGYTEEDAVPLADPASAFHKRPTWQRLAVLAAGPVFNLILPVCVFTALLMAGEPQPASVIGSITSEGAAAAAGLQAGDRVVAVDGQPINTWRQLGSALSGRESVTLEIQRGGDRLTVPVALPAGTGLGIDHERLDTMAGVADPRSPAGRAGLRTGERIAAVDGQTVGSWDELSRRLSTAGTSASLRVVGEGGARTLTLTADPGWAPVDPEVERDAAAAWGLESASLFIGSVGETVDTDSSGFLAGCRPKAAAPPSPAALAGLRAGDRFLRLNDKPVSDWGDVLDIVRQTMVGEGDAAHAQPLDAVVVRDGERLALTLTPTVIRDTDPAGQYYYRPILGVMRMGGYIDGEMTRVYYPFGAAAKQAVTETVGLGGFILQHLGKLVTGEAAVQKSLGGPVEMFRQAGNAAERGLFDWARLMGMLSISLGIVNLLPVPVLDGGQILFNAVEGIRGRPLSLALRERVQQVGLLFLVVLMLSVLVFDIQRIFEGPG